MHDRLLQLLVRRHLLYVFKLQTGVLRKTCKHSWPDFLAIVEREHDIRPTFASERLVRTRLTFDAPADLEQRL